MTTSQYAKQPWLTPARLCASTNISATYNNGSLNNGVGATLTCPSGVLTIDSETVLLNDRVLLLAQSNGNENGVYICTQQGAVGIPAILQRSADVQCQEQVSQGYYISIGAGTLHAGSMMVICEPLPQHFGIDALTFVDASGTSNDVELPVSVGNLSSFFDTNGKIQDSGITVADVQLNTNIIAGRTGNVSDTPNPYVTLSVPGVTVNSIGFASIQASINQISVQKVTCNDGELVINMSGDPGANLTFNYLVFLNAQ